MANLHRYSTVVMLALVLIGSASRVSGTSTLDNVATQWNSLFNVLYCRAGGRYEPNIVLAHLHLAQWHALIAVKRVTDSEISQEVAVAYASHTVLANYLPFEKPLTIDLLLDRQLTALKATKAQQTLSKRLGEAVAIDLMEKRRAGREFTVHELKSALNSEGNNPRPGLYRYLNTTPEYRAAAAFIFFDIPIARPFVVYSPLRFIKDHLANLKPPIIPSAEWDKAYASIVQAGRAGPHRTAEMNATAAFVACAKVDSTVCIPESVWGVIARSSLPPTLSLSDTVTIFVTLAVTMHEVLIVPTNLQYGFWFWRPQSAMRAGDPHHAPIPDWTPWQNTPPHAEYPSGTVSSWSAAAKVLYLDPYFSPCTISATPSEPYTSAFLTT